METITSQIQHLLQHHTEGLVPEQAASLRVQCMECINQFFDQLPVQPQPVSHLSAQEVTVEFIDKTSGLLYRRQLPIDVEENGNGIKLTAEDLYGKPLQMVFYTAESIRRINDLMGNGPDEDRCHTHS